MLERTRKWQAVFYFIQKEFRQVFRDHDMLRVIFMVPMVQLFLFAYAANTDLRNVTVGLLDEDNSAMSRRVAEAVFRSDVFVAGPVVQNPRQLQDLLNRERARVTLWIPRNFERDVLGRRATQIAIAVDGRQSGLAGRASGYAQTIIQNEIARTWSEKGIRSPDTGSPVRIEGVSSFFYNPELESRYYMVPGILVLLITVVSMLLTGMSMVREKEIGTLEQLLVTPITPAQLIAGKTLPFAVITFGELAAATTVAVLWFRLPLEGSVGVLALGVGAYLLVTLGIGLLVSTVSSTQQQAMFSVWFIMVFAILMSGFFYPVENMPGWAQVLSSIDPLRYTMNVVRGVFLKGAGFSDLWREIAVLGVMGTAVFCAAVMRLQKRIA